MAGQNENQNTSSSQGSGGAGDRKLYAGKYQTVEELEKAYSESEKKFHESRQENREVLDRLDRIEQRFTQPVSEVDEGYGRGSVVAPVGDPNDQEVLTKFYTKPSATLREIEERAAQRVEERIAQRQKINQDYQTRVAQWTERNKDVTPYGDLLTHYVQQTDARWTPEKRLDEAAKAVRERVAQLRGSPRASDPNPDEFVDGASGGTAPNRGSNTPAPKVDAESELAKYASERNAKARRPLNVRK